jgi:arylsulfatase A-like enzyme
MQADQKHPTKPTSWWQTALCLALFFWLLPSDGLCQNGDAQSGADNDSPNVLFISVDDLNDWIGCMKGHPQAKTPNMDRLAASGTLFTNAHCPAPACNPSRSAIMTGISPHISGVYDNRQKMRELMPDETLIPKYFSENGYWSAGSGKILHYFTDADSWDDYFPAKETENPFPSTKYPDIRPVSLPRGGDWQYIETDWGPLDVSDEEYGGDYSVAQWVGKELGKKHDKPFFLACGIYRPHEPWFVPKKYFDMFPLEDIQLPPGYREGDLDDLPPEAQRRARNRYFAHIQKQDQWKQGIQGYLASIAFADAMIGRVLDALDNGPNGDNTIVVLWSDHGWHLGEKEHWQKYTAWRTCTRVPLMIRVPEGVKGLEQGTQTNTVCNEPVNLLSLFPTLTELAGLPEKKSISAPSLLPLLRDPEHDWPHVAITHLDRPGNYSVSDTNWRYIQYANGEQELYDIKSDPFEWKNLASNPEYADRIQDLKSKAPSTFAEHIPAKKQTLPKLTWNPNDGGKLPKSNPTGEPLDIYFKNSSEQPVDIFRVDSDGKRHAYGTLERGWFKPYQTRDGELWLITDKENQLLGYFVATDQMADAIIPN